MEDTTLRDVFDALALVGSTRMPADIVSSFFPSASPESPVDWAWFSKAADAEKLTPAAAVAAALATLPSSIASEDITSTLASICSAISQSQLTRVFTKLEGDGPANHAGLTDVILELRRLTKLNNPRFVRDAIVALRQVGKLPVPKTLTSIGGGNAASGGRDRGKSFKSVVEAAQLRNRVVGAAHIASSSIGDSDGVGHPRPRHGTATTRDAECQWDPPSSWTAAQSWATQTDPSLLHRNEVSCQAQLDPLASVDVPNARLRTEVVSLANLVQSKAEELRSMQGQLANLANLSLAPTATIPRTLAADAMNRLELETDAAHIASRLRMKEAALARLLELERREAEVTERIRRLELTSGSVGFVPSAGAFPRSAAVAPPASRSVLLNEPPAGMEHAWPSPNRTARWTRS